eukprot:2464729-Rhodomonas_salina.1
MSQPLRLSCHVCFNKENDAPLTCCANSIAAASTSSSPAPRPPLPYARVCVLDPIICTPNAVSLSQIRVVLAQIRPKDAWDSGRLEPQEQAYAKAMSPKMRRFTHNHTWQSYLEPGWRCRVKPARCPEPVAPYASSVPDFA